jgi:hypothetical protein
MSLQRFCLSSARANDWPKKGGPITSMAISSPERQPVDSSAFGVLLCTFKTRGSSIARFDSLDQYPQ